MRQWLILGAHAELSIKQSLMSPRVRWLKNSTILQLYYVTPISTKTAISEKLGFRIDNTVWTVFAPSEWTSALWTGLITKKINTCKFSVYSYETVAQISQININQVIFENILKNTEKIHYPYRRLWGKWTQMDLFLNLLKSSQKSPNSYFCEIFELQSLEKYTERKSNKWLVSLW
jgi:hypothetical protein